MFAFGFQESARPVVGSRRATRLRVCPPMLLAPLKSPPTRTLPSAWIAMEKMLPVAFGFHESARPVVASRRAMRLRVCPPMLWPH